MLGSDKLLGLPDGVADGEPVEREAMERLHTLARRVHHRALLGVETLLAHVGSLDERNDGEVEVAGEGIVAAVVGRDGHDGSGAVAREHVF